MGGVAKWPLLVPLFRDDPVAQHMVEARNCLKTWNKPALVMFGDEGELSAQEGNAFDLTPSDVNAKLDGSTNLSRFVGKEMFLKGEKRCRLKSGTGSAIYS